MKQCRILTLLSTALGTGFLVFMLLFLHMSGVGGTYRTQLENNYMKSFYEMVNNVNSLEVDMSKIIATNSLDSQRQLLDNIYESCVLGVNNINLLPISYDKLTSINHLLNTTGGFAYVLLQDTYNGKKINTDDYVQLNDLYSSIKEIQYDLNQYLSKLQYDFSILDIVHFSDADSNEFSGGLINTESSTAKVPTLIYDGPFSDSVLNREIVGLTEKMYSQEEVEEKLNQLFTGFAIYYIGDTMGKFETYNFDVKGDIDLYVSVTKKGGFLLTITAFGKGSGNKLSTAEGVSLAESFAHDLQLSNMFTVWKQRTGNILYVNLAPIEDHVIYYSDLIKVKIDLSLGLVVGWEATHYATNNKSRSFTSTLGLFDAQNSLNNILEIEERNLTIIPDKYVGEISTYEFICTWQDYTYYIYIDANTGKEINIMRVISTTNGELLM